MKHICVYVTICINLVETIMTRLTELSYTSYSLQCAGSHSENWNYIKKEDFLHNVIKTDTFLL